MEQTLGKRIMLCRKNLGMTQNDLAETLGVTAQAVSKWENDQSCPDINILPKLAQIFGITTDALLGHSAEPVHEAQILDNAQPEENETEGLRVQKGNWEFKYEGGKRSAIFFALLVLTTGVLALLSEVLNLDVSFWSILWPTALLVFGIQGILEKFSFFSIGSILFGGYFLLDNLNVVSFDLGDMVFPIIVVLFGLSLLADALRKPKKRRFSVIRNGKQAGKQAPRQCYSVDGETFACNMSFGENRQEVLLPRLSGGDINCSFGDFIVDLSGCEEVSENCELDVSCAFGELTILVPSRYQVVSDTSTAFACFDTSGTPDAVPSGIIHLDGSVSFGQITVRYI